MIALALLLPATAPAQDADAFFLQGFEAWRAGDLLTARDRFSAGLTLREDPTAREYLNRIDAELGIAPAPQPAPASPAPAPAPPSVAAPVPVPTPDAVADPAAATMPLPELRGRWRSEATGDCEARYSEFDLDGTELVITLFEGGEITRWVSYTVLQYDGANMTLRFDRIEPPMPVFEAAYGMTLEATAEPDRFTWRRADGDESHLRCP
ncbi:MAG: hypothetical protein O3A96_08675 [Proteobacteria bacterium]|nr:hypothetical protein [Pseudomonadota bacterium]